MSIRLGAPASVDINSLEIVVATFTARLESAARSSPFPAALGLRGGGEHRRGELFVQAEKMLDPFAVARERLLAIKPIDGFVERTVRLAEILRHDIGIVEVGGSRALVRGSCVEHGFRKLLEFCFGGFVELRPGERV
jgi:hypothetical protein